MRALGIGAHPDDVAILREWNRFRPRQCNARAGRFAEAYRFEPRFPFRISVICRYPRHPYRRWRRGSPRRRGRGP